ncbi:MAG: DUF61 family protein [Thermoprotei archaeon]
MIDKIIDIGLRGLLNYYPSERPTLAEVLKGKNVIKLSDGSEIEIPKRKAEEMGSRVPIYLWDLVRLPIVIVKTSNSGEFQVEEYKWNREALKALLGRDNVDALMTGDVERLVAQYGTAIFITLSVSINNSEESQEDY